MALASSFKSWAALNWLTLHELLLESIDPRFYLLYLLYFIHVEVLAKSATVWRCFDLYEFIQFIIFIVLQLGLAHFQIILVRAHLCHGLLLKLLVPALAHFWELAKVVDWLIIEVLVPDLWRLRHRGISSTMLGLARYGLHQPLSLSQLLSKLGLHGHKALYFFWFFIWRFINCQLRTGDFRLKRIHICQHNIRPQRLMLLLLLIWTFSTSRLW